MKENLPLIQRRLRVVKWLSTTPALGVCTLCSREFKVPMSALRTTAGAQANLQGQFDRHKCETQDSGQSADVLLRQEPDEEEEEDEDDRKNEDDGEDDDEETDDGYSERTIEATPFSVFMRWQSLYDSLASSTTMCSSERK